MDVLRSRRSAGAYWRQPVTHLVVLVSTPPARSGSVQRLCSYLYCNTPATIHHSPFHSGHRLLRWVYFN
eukprot:26330-Eustigmatos_ZCMA.PRE.1